MIKKAPGSIKRRLIIIITRQNIYALTLPIANTMMARRNKDKLRVESAITKE